MFDHFQFALIHGPNFPGSYAILLFIASDLASITSHIHNWVLFLFWLHPFILSGAISPLISSSILGTYRPGEFLFQYPVILPFNWAQIKNSATLGYIESVPRLFQRLVAPGAPWLVATALRVSESLPHGYITTSSFLCLWKLPLPLIKFMIALQAHLGNSGLSPYLKVFNLIIPVCYLLSPTLGDPKDCNSQALLSIEFSRQEYWSGLPFPSPGDLLDPEIKPRSPALQTDSLPSEPPEKPLWIRYHNTKLTSCKQQLELDFKRLCSLLFFFFWF